MNKTAVCFQMNFLSSYISFGKRTQRSGSRRLGGAPDYCLAGATAGTLSDAEHELVSDLLLLMC